MRHLQDAIYIFKTKATTKPSPSPCRRDADENPEQDEGMEDWDQETLEKAIAQKHGSENKNRPTEIVCKFFIDAVEKRQYGWFWQCPNGKDCKYRHALPPGYVLKSQMKQMLEEEAANVRGIWCILLYDILLRLTKVVDLYA